LQDGFTVPPWLTFPEAPLYWLGNTEQRAIQESFGIMVNYLYDHDSIEDNHEAFVRDGTIVRSPDVDALLEPMRGARTRATERR
jgi:hypothetical protein